MSYADLYAYFANHGIILTIVKKPIKNVNFRLSFKEGVTHFHVSSPLYTPSGHIHDLILSRSSWAIQHHQTHHARHHAILTLWGEPMDMDKYLRYTPIKGLTAPKSPTQERLCQLAIYEHELKKRLPTLALTWQPRVGRIAKEIRTKKMRTRWGSCNTRHGRIWLSTYLPAHPYECTEYVFVHELCHLIYPNHSPAFWRAVKKAMPDYQTWHDLLKHQTH